MPANRAGPRFRAAKWADGDLIAWASVGRSDPRLCLALTIGSGMAQDPAPNCLRPVKRRRERHLSRKPGCASV